MRASVSHSVAVSEAGELAEISCLGSRGLEKSVVSEGACVRSDWRPAKRRRGMHVPQLLSAQGAMPGVQIHCLLVIAIEA